MELIELTDISQELSPRHYQQLESGGILFFPRTPIGLSEDQCRVLLSQRQSEASYHKNIAYRPSEDNVTGLAKGSERDQLRNILKDYCHKAAEVIARLLPRYASSSQLDFTSFRPFQEEGRTLSLRARNDLLHIDAFPTRPTNGDRILRFFTNIHPEQRRVWITSEPFPELVERFAGEAWLLKMAHKRSSPLWRTLAAVARSTRLYPSIRSPYDAIMLRFHHFMKENHRFQETCPKVKVEFPPMSSWLVFTDMVSHAVLAGQFALEQTFIVPRKALLHPDQAPVNILERLAGIPLTWRS